MDMTFIAPLNPLHGVTMLVEKATNLPKAKVRALRTERPFLV